MIRSKITKGEHSVEGASRTKGVGSTTPVEGACSEAVVPAVSGVSGAAERAAVNIRDGHLAAEKTTKEKVHFIARPEIHFCLRCENHKSIAGVLPS